MITVSPRARRRQDRNGDPLDGLVNLFDLGIVLAVAFLLAALSSHGLTRVLTSGDADDQITVPSDSDTGEVPAKGEKVIGNGKRVGEVYRLDDGRLVYVVPTSR